jgi:hypothetical protein
MAVLCDGSLATSGSSALPRGSTLSGMEPIRVELMNDYTADWPLWTDSLTRESDWDLSPPLRRRLRAWSAFFEEHFHWEHGWDDPARCREYRAEGLELYRLLTAELGPGYAVELRLPEAGDC